MGIQLRLTDYMRYLQLDKVKDNQVVHRSTLERRSIYRSIRNEDPRYADSIVGSPDYMVREIEAFLLQLDAGTARPLKFSAESPTAIPWTIGRSAASFSNFLQGFLHLVEVLLRRHGRI